MFLSPEEYLQLLSSASVGETIHTIGDVSLQDILVPSDNGSPRQIELQEPDYRIFEVEAKLVGNLSIQDIIDHIFKPRQRLTRGDKVGEKLPVLSISVKGIMTKPVITAIPNSKLREAESAALRPDDYES